MLSITNFDELNNLVGYKRSIPYEKYFGEMELSESDKRKRIQLAEALEIEFLGALALAFEMQKIPLRNSVANPASYSTADLEYAYENRIRQVQEQMEEAYLVALATVLPVSQDIRDYVHMITTEMADTTNEHRDEPYYYSHDRAKVIAENESNTVWNNDDYKKAVQSGKKKKEWHTMEDRKVRSTHTRVNRKVKPINEPFSVGGSLMQYPKDTSLGASTDEIANCRCTIKYI